MELIPLFRLVGVKSYPTNQTDQFNFCDDVWHRSIRCGKNKCRPSLQCALHNRFVSTPSGDITRPTPFFLTRANSCKPLFFVHFKYCRYCPSRCVFCDMRTFFINVPKFLRIHLTEGLKFLRRCGHYTLAEQFCLNVVA